MEIRKIKTRLAGKRELFRVIALGEALRMPVLFVGPPGVAKTQALLDYGKAMLVRDGIDPKEVAKKTFIIELDEGTKSSEVKGRPNMKELLENKLFKMDTPIADSLFVMINEVDKGTSGVRNTLLSVMREKKLFLGGEVKNCQWKVFVGSCNNITIDEENVPFWDRFLIKQRVDRVSPELFPKMWQQEEDAFDVKIPDAKEIEECPLGMGKMVSFIQLVHDFITDRTITHTLNLVKAIKLIWEISDKEAILKACSFIAPDHVSNVSANIEDPFVKEIKNKIMQISKHSDISYIINVVAELDGAFLEMSKDHSNNSELAGLKGLLKKEMAKNKAFMEFRKKQEEKKKIAKAAMSSVTTNSVSKQVIPVADLSTNAGNGHDMSLAIQEEANPFNE